MDVLIKSLLPMKRAIDSVNRTIGRYLSWLILAAVLVSAVNAVVRKSFAVSSNSWLELQWMLFGIVFLLCSPWTLLDNEHIRIDIDWGAVPFVLIQVIMVVLVIIFPAMVMHYKGAGPSNDPGKVKIDLPQIDSPEVNQLPKF